jgi:2,5-diketo-D-gluconate reductase A
VWQVPEDEVVGAVTTAIETGYRSIDTARIYGNEEGTGEAIKKSGVAREDLFVTTKVWNDDQGFDSTLKAFDASMARLDLETLDLFLIHWPAPKQDAYVDTWKALLRLREEGRVRAVGTCNFHVPHLQRLLDETGELPAINQVELHPYLQQNELREFHAANGIVTEAWSPLASGGDVLQDETIGKVAAKHGVTPAQAILRWHLDTGNVVIPKSVTPSRIRENFDIFGFKLDEDDLAAIATLDRGHRTGPDPDAFWA